MISSAGANRMHRTICVGEMSVTFLKTRHETAGAFDLFELTIPPFGRIPLPHIHRKYDEPIFAVDGTMPSTTDQTKFLAGRHSSSHAVRLIFMRIAAARPRAFSVSRLRASWDRSTTLKLQLTFTPMAQTSPASLP